VARKADEFLDREERQRHAEDLTISSGADTAIALGSAAIQIMPAIGGALATLISEFIPRRRQQRMEEFVQELHKAVKVLETSINESSLLSDRTADVVEGVLERVIRTEADGKRQYYAAAVANAIAAPDRPGEELARMMDALDELRPSHLRLLAKLDENPDPPADFNIIAGGIYSYLELILPGVSEDQIRMDWGDLARLNILDSFPTGTMTRPGIVSTRGRILPFGRRFIEFITLPDTSQAP
jgi:hypothetical protein